MAVNIPQSLRPRLLSIATIDNTIFNKVTEVFQTMPPMVHLGSILAFAKQHCGEISQEDILAVIESGLGLQAGFLRANVSEKIFITDVLKSLKEKTETASLNGFDEKLFIERIERLLGIESLKISAKSLNLLNESERLLIDSRILTDIRPVFGKEIGARPLGALIVHSLRLHYHEETAGHEFFVSLDAKDIKDMIHALERALEKEKCLNSLLASAEISSVIVQPEKEILE